MHLRLTVAFEESEGSYKEASRCKGEQDDGVAVGGLSFWRGGGGVVLALSATLWVG